MDVTVGIPIYNEERNISMLIDSINNQKLNQCVVKEIVFILSGCTDNSELEIKRGMRNSKFHYQILYEDVRSGKYSAINELLKNSVGEAILLESADTIPKADAFEKLITPLVRDKKIGIVAGRPIPINKKTNMVTEIVKLQWQLHHFISLDKPKYGEMIVFRNAFKSIDKTEVDEEFIAMKLNNLGYNGYYASNAICYNNGPETVKDFILQRRRINCGHYRLYNTHNYRCSSYNNFRVLKSALSLFGKFKIFTIIFGGFLEGYTRALGMKDYFFKRNHFIWNIVKTTKNKILPATDI